MKVIRFKSGLGNQMFQYALYKSLKESFNDVRADLYYIKSKNDHNGYELNNIFGIEVDEIRDEEIYEYKKLLDINRSFFNKLRRKFFGTKTSHFIEKEFIYDVNFMKRNNIVLDGYWQDIRYFKNIEDKLREDFKFDIEKINLNKKNHEILKKITNSTSVSIHIRRGDYLNNEYYDKFGAVCSLDYYKKAIQIINNKYTNINYFIFSNDIDWCKKNLKLKNVNYIDWNTGSESYMDMYIMSKCKHNILANSSFSWWAAWLNDHGDKEVICPSPWFFDDKCTNESISLDNWTKIEVPIKDEKETK